MVFCYKIITDTPRRSGNVSPRKQSPARIPDYVPTSLSQLMASRQHEWDGVLESIPEREWRLLAALARKHDERVQREDLAEQFRRLWQQEKIEREMVEAESSQQYARFLAQQRAAERALGERRRRRLAVEQMTRRGLILSRIQHKERRSRLLLASRDDLNSSQLVSRALTSEARGLLAAERRALQHHADSSRRRLELLHAQQRADDAQRKREDILTDSAKRAAISNALSSWEVSAVRHEVAALEAARGARAAARAARAQERGQMVAEQRARQTQRARRLAAVTAQLRDDLRAGRGGRPDHH